jgi:fimbrial chaperone protein
MLRRIAPVLLLLATAGTASAGSFEAAPTTIEMPRGKPSAVLYLTNHQDTPLAFQVEAFEWRQDQGEDALAPTTALQASPPIARLAPGARQTVRLRYFGPVRPQEQAFRLVITELPAPAAVEGQAVRVLLQFRLPLFVAGTSDAPADVRWTVARDGPDFVLTAQNEGGARAKLSRLELAASPEAKPIPGADLVYVLAGGHRTWRIPAPEVRRGDPLRVTAAQDGVAHRSSFTLEARQ